MIKKDICEMRKTLLLNIFLCCIFPLLLAGCNNANNTDPEITEYEQQLKSYYDSIMLTSESLNSINPEDESAKETYLMYIDNIKDSVAGIDSLNDPEGYEDVGTNAYSALTKINTTSSLLHEIYGTDEYDWDKDNEAYNSYIECIENLKSIGSILMSKNQK